MVKHKFNIGMTDQQGNATGAQCVRCSHIVLFENGKVPDYILEQGCNSEDVNQAAVRIIGEATEESYPKGC